MNGFQLSDFLFLKMSLQTATYTYKAIWHLLVWWTAPKKALILTFIFCIFLAVMISISSWVNIQSRRAICHENYVSGLCKIFLGSGSPGWYGLLKKMTFFFECMLWILRNVFLNDWLVDRFPGFTQIPQIKKSTLES